MKRVQYLHYGAPEELRLDEVTPPDAGQGQIRVQVSRSSQPDGLENSPGRDEGAFRVPVSTRTGP
jgi:hypothetical protein